MSLVQVESAQGLRAADFSGSSDPFCVVTLGDFTVRTQVVAALMDPTSSPTCPQRCQNAPSGHSWHLKMQACMRAHMQAPISADTSATKLVGCTGDEADAGACLE